MQMTGEQRIAASRHLVWQALNDPEILRQCIPGCQSLERESAERLRATVEIKIGPIGARFNGAVTLSDLDPPNGYTLTGEGQGGTVGSARGAARVCLADDGDGTRLSYDVDAQIGGRLAQLGGPIIDATARQLAGKFFAQLSAMVGPPEAAAPTRSAAAEQTVSATKSPLPPAATQRLPMAWILAVAVAAFVGFLVGRSQPAAAGSDWMGLSIGLLLIIVAAAGFEYGRRTAAPVMMLDAALLARLAGEPKP